MGKTMIDEYSADELEKLAKERRQREEDEEKAKVYKPSLREIQMWSMVNDGLVELAKSRKIDTANKSPGQLIKELLGLPQKSGGEL